MRDGNFTLSGLEGVNLQGRTVGLVGTGKIGLAVGRCVFSRAPRLAFLRSTRILARGFQSNVIAYDIRRDHDAAAEAGITYVDTLDAVLETSHIVSLHVPLLDSTHHIIDADALEKMRDGAILVNTSRGGLIDTTALVARLKTGKLKAVALDVYENEGEYFFRDSSDKVHGPFVQAPFSLHYIVRLFKTTSSVDWCLSITSSSPVTRPF